MRRLSVSLLALLALTLLAVLGPAQVAAQQPVPDLTLGFQPESAVGDEVALGAYLLDPAGNPIRGERVTFSTDVEFMNTLGTVVIGRATTDENGLALLVHEPKTQGERTITARFAGNEVFAPAETSQPISIAPGPPTYHAEALFRIPGANVGTVVAVLGVVWGLYLLVVGLFLLIARARHTPHAGTEVR